MHTRRQLFLVARCAPGVRQSRVSTRDLARNVTALAGHGAVSCRVDRLERGNAVGGLRKSREGGDKSARYLPVA